MKKTKGVGGVRGHVESGWRLIVQDKPSRLAMPRPTLARMANSACEKKLSPVYFWEEAAVEGAADAAILELHHISIPARPGLLLLSNELGINVDIGHV